MKRVMQILTLSLLLGLVLAVPAQAETEENSALEVLPTAVVSAMEKQVVNSSDAAPDAAPARPDPVFLAGSDAGGAGGADAGLVNGGSSTAPRTHIMYEDHLCCPYGATGCDCSYWPGRFCDPIGCPNRQQPNC